MLFAFVTASSIILFLVRKLSHRLPVVQAYIILWNKNLAWDDRKANYKSFYRYAAHFSTSRQQLLPQHSQVFVRANGSLAAVLYRAAASPASLIVSSLFIIWHQSLQLLRNDFRPQQCLIRYRLQLYTPVNLKISDTRSRYNVGWCLPQVAINGELQSFYRPIEIFLHCKKGQNLITET